MKAGVSLVRTAWFSALAAVILLLAGCDVAQPGSLAVSTVPPNGIHIQGDNQTIDFTNPANMCIGSLVADVGIAGLGTSHWNTPDGKRSATLDKGTILKNGYAIYTPVRFSHMHIHRDQRHQPTTEFATIGGAVGPDSYDMDYPQVTPGGNYLLVLVPGTDPVAKAYTEKWLVVVAAYPIDAQGVVTFMPEHMEGKGQQSEKVPAVTKPLSQITQQLANCK